MRRLAVSAFQYVGSTSRAFWYHFSDKFDGFLWRVGAIEHWSDSVDPGANNLSVRDIFAPSKVERPAIQVENRGHSVRHVERQLLASVQVDV
jgi:hypothetical protein